MLDVVGLGENSIDEVYRLPAWPLPGSPTAKLQIDAREICVGGQVATTMGACATLGLRTKYVGAFGDDEGGRRVREALDARGVDTRDALVRAAPNRHAVILVDAASGERVVLWERDARLTIRSDEVRPEWCAGVRALHLDGIDEGAALVAARMGRAAHLHVTSDIDRVTEQTEALVAAVTVPIFAQHAVAALTGEADPERALRAIRRRHDGLLCVTLGSDGAMLLEGDVLHHEPAFAVTVVDSTGAGDVFRAGFLHGLLRALPPRALLRFANAAAAIACTRAGAMNGAPTLDEVSDLLRGQT